MKKPLHSTIGTSLFASVALALITVVASAQAPATKQTIFDEATVIYKESIFGGVSLHTNGFGGHFTYGRNLTAFKMRTFQADVVVMKHPKEVRSYNAIYEDSRSYIFGKVNSLFLIRPTIGTRVLKYDKIRTSGVAVGYSWRVGPSIGLTKPVYLEVLVADATGFGSLVVERATAEVYEDKQIFGRAGGLRGFNEMQIQPGVHGCFALNFDYDPRREGIKGLEIGAKVDFFPLGDVEILALAENTNLFVNFYVILQFGKKFNR